MMKKTDGKTDQLLTRGVAEVVERGHLRARLAAGDRLRVKLGIDPTGARLHLGHAVLLKILRRFQDAGHTAVLIIGDTTAMIGDPSGKNETRPPLTKDDIARNFSTYERQALKVLDRQRLEVRWQSEWFRGFTLADTVREMSKVSAGWITSHETFRARLKAKRPLAFHELLYPLLQAYDSVATRADVELGGLDQRFNILTGRELMRAHGLEPQDVVLAKYLIGTDGQKMGKSLGNFIALEEEPFEMFGQLMSMPDEPLRDYFELATDVATSEMEHFSWSGTGARDTKLRLAKTLVAQYHGTKSSDEAAQRWAAYSRGDEREPVAELFVHDAPDLRQALVSAKLAGSKSEAQRMIEQGGVTVDGRVQKDWKTSLKGLSKGAHKVVVGKRKKTIKLLVK